MKSIQLAPFEVLDEATNLEILAQSCWKTPECDELVGLSATEKLLFFAPQNRAQTAPSEWNFLLTPLGNPQFSPPAKAIEKLGKARTVELFFRRAISNGSWGRLLVLRHDREQFLVVLNADGRHLLASALTLRSPRNRDWTPFEWSEMDAPTLRNTPASTLFERVQSAWNDPRSTLAFARGWRGFDYNERLWRSLEWHRSDADFVREVIRDSIQISPNIWNGERTGIAEWKLYFSLHKKLPRHFSLAAHNTRHGGNLSFAQEKCLQDLFVWAHPSRLSSLKLLHLAQREWLENSQGETWNFSLEIPRVSAHEQLEAMLRLQSNLPQLSGELSRNWMESWTFPLHD